MRHVNSTDWWEVLYSLPATGDLVYFCHYNHSVSVKAVLEERGVDIDGPTVIVEHHRS